LRAPAVAAREGWKRGDDDGGVGMFAGVNDSGRGAARAAEFYFGVRADIDVFEHVLRAAVTTGCLHGDLKLAPRQRAGLAMSNGGAELVIGRTEKAT
jgi:hypothetical protein